MKAPSLAIPAPASHFRQRIHIVASDLCLDCRLEQRAILQESPLEKPAMHGKAIAEAIVVYEVFVGSNSPTAIQVQYCRIDGRTPASYTASTLSGAWMRRASVNWGSFLRFVCVIALAMIGFAHSPVAAYPDEARTSAYELPDGSFAALCHDDHDSKPHAEKKTGCEACRLAAAILLPAPVFIGDIEAALSEEVKVFERRQRIGRALYPPNTGPRAPPAVLMFV